MSSKRRSFLTILWEALGASSPRETLPTVSAEGPPAGDMPGDAERGAERRGGHRWGEILRVQALTVGLLTKKVTPDQLFRQIVNGAADSLAADETSLMLLEGDELRVVAACQPEPRSAVWQQPTRLGEGVAGLVAQTGPV